MAGNPIATTNECTFSLLPDKRILLLGRAQTVPLSYVIFDADLSNRTPLQRVQGVPSPVCEGSLVSGHPQGPGSGHVFYSNPSSRHWRGNLSIHSSVDGVHWDHGFEVWGAQTHQDTNSGYSALLARREVPPAHSHPPFTHPHSLTSPLHPPRSLIFPFAHLRLLSSPLSLILFHYLPPSFTHPPSLILPSRTSLSFSKEGMCNRQTVGQTPGYASRPSLTTRYCVMDVTPKISFSRRVSGELWS